MSCGPATLLRAGALLVSLGMLDATACGGDRSTATTDAGTIPTIDSPEPPQDTGFDVAIDARVDCHVQEQDGTVCACFEIGQRPPLLYLLLDRSGSMEGVSQIPPPLRSPPTQVGPAMSHP